MPHKPWSCYAFCRVRLLLRYVKFESYRCCAYKCCVTSHCSADVRGISISFHVYHLQTHLGGTPTLDFYEVVMHVHVQVFLQTYTFIYLGSTPQRGVIRSYDTVCLILQEILQPISLRTLYWITLALLRRLRSVFQFYLWAVRFASLRSLFIFTSIQHSLHYCSFQVLEISKRNSSNFIPFFKNCFRDPF